MRDDLVPGNPFSDLRLPETTGKAIRVSKEGATGDPHLVKHHITVPPRVP
jgi:hypothetical protein